jgi:hypothetical protein
MPGSHPYPMQFTVAADESRHLWRQLRGSWNLSEDLTAPTDP